MKKLRRITAEISPKLVMEGAGVLLYRSIQPSKENPFDPFLLFDHFAFNDPTEGVNPGFPNHPHRGLETVTYILAGTVRHRDSLGNKGLIGPGEVQWMSAGSGIMHEEMPLADESGKMHGFQLWVNLPADHKMSKPAYQDILSSQLLDSEFDGYTVKVIAGEYKGIIGPVKDIFINPTYMDVKIQPGKTFTFDLADTHTAGIYHLEGVSDVCGKRIEYPCLLKLEDGESIEVTAVGNVDSRLILISGKKINEPIVPYGPFVMNTVEEIQQAINDLRSGNFIR